MIIYLKRRKLELLPVRIPVRKIRDYDIPFEDYTKNYRGKVGIERDYENQKLKKEIYFLQRESEEKESEYFLIALAGIAFDLKRTKGTRNYEENKERFFKNTAKWLCPTSSKKAILRALNNDFSTINYKRAKGFLKEAFEKYYPDL